MIKLLTIIGARPQIIKAAALSRAIKNKFSDKVQEKILHTGQHYDENMSEVFFKELNIPLPDYNLQVGSGTHGEQTAKMISGIESVLLSEFFDALVVYGDTNSTLAGAIAAAKLNIPIIHIEAGLRSYNMTMPEEQNRIVCDHLSTFLFSPTDTGVNNLKKEGLVYSQAHFNDALRPMVFNSGDIMYDNSMFFADISGEKTNVISRLNLSKNNFILATIHRNNNTDEPERLTNIFSALLEISEKESIEVVIPLHPRTSKILEKNLEKDIFQKVSESNLIKIIPPVSFFEIIELEKYAKMVLTDSGGVQKEAYFFKKPCVILRPETEWVEIVEEGCGLIADADKEKIIDSYYSLLNKNLDFKPVFGNGKASEFILKKVVEHLS